MDAAPPHAVYRFDRFTLDLARGALLGSDGAEVPLRPKSFALLRLLVENAGSLLDRDAIMAAVWPDVVVSDASITQCIRDIRRALGDEAQRLLKTVPKRGYMFAAEVSPAEAPPRPPRAPSAGWPRSWPPTSSATRAWSSGTRPARWPRSRRCARRRSTRCWPSTRAGSSS